MRGEVNDMAIWLYSRLNGAKRAGLRCFIAALGTLGENHKTF
jgi:hypothetical protein